MKTKKSIILSMQSNAQAYNKHLKDTVESMNLHELLCNCHPRDREIYARRLQTLGIDTKKYINTY